MKEGCTITRLQAVSVAILFSLGSLLVFGGEFSAGPDSWLAALACGIIALPVWLICGRLSSLYPRKSLFEIFLEIYGKVGGRILIAFYLIYVLNLCSTVIRNCTEFMQIVALSRTPQIAMAILLVGLAFFLAYKGVGLIGRFSFWSAILCFLAIGVTIIAASPYFDIKYLEPVLANGILPVFKSGLLVAPYRLADIFLIIGVFAYMKQSGKRVRWLLSGWGTIVVISCLVSLILILVLGVPMAQKLNFPFYATASLINIGEFLTQVEVFISGSFLLTGIVKMSVAFHAVDRGLGLLCGTTGKGQYLWAIGLFCTAYSAVLYESTVQMRAFLQIYIYLATPFQLLIPLATWIFAEIRRVRERTRLASVLALSNTSAEK